MPGEDRGRWGPHGQERPGWEEQVGWGSMGADRAGAQVTEAMKCFPSRSEGLFCLNVAERLN